ncbi:hypothetical protein DH2020_049087 [Rehmannia glutinosa]|uniref:Dymeclin n=1 Tax=Rehmannia glutinosa TaxID=99300 RepID=A0ABR0U3Y1_REHGL
MGGTPSTPRLGGGARPQETAEYLIGEFVGEKSFPLASDYWHKLLELPLDLRWQSHRVRQACQLFALNASFISSVFLKYLIENSKSDNFEELYLLLDESDPLPNNFSEDLNDLHIIFSSSGPFRAVDLLDFVPRLFHLQAGQHVENLIMFSALNFIGKIDISPETNLLHQELLNFILITMSTQLLSGPTPGLNDIHPFIDAAMAQESSLVNLVMRKLLLNYITHPQFPVNSSSSITLYEGNQPGVLRRVSSAAVDYVKYKSDNNSSEALLKEETYFSENPFRKALENAQDIEFDRDDTEANAHGGPLIRLPFASLFDTLGMCLANETSVLLLYSLVHGNSDFLEYVLVRTDLDTLLMPMLETLYNAPSRTSNHIYMVLVIFLILSQDSSFNASVHKLMLPNVPWYQERLLNQTSLGSLMDVYLHTNCLATLANMAPHVHRLSSYASQQLVSLFDMLSRKYNKLAEIKNEKMNVANGDPRGDSLPEDPVISPFLDYEQLQVVYSIIHRQEVFLPFKNHPRFSELLENIYTVSDFFNSRIDAQKVDGEWSVEKVLQVVINHCRSWRGEGMKDINGQVEKIQNGELKEHALQIETPV